jgi:hypothetical protein
MSTAKAKSAAGPLSFRSQESRHPPGEFLHAVGNFFTGFLSMVTSEGVTIYYVCDYSIGLILDSQDNGRKDNKANLMYQNNSSNNMCNNLAMVPALQIEMEIMP